jgi:O-methyltransferase
MTGIRRTALRSRSITRALSTINHGLGHAGVKLTPRKTLDEQWTRTFLHLAEVVERAGGVPGDVVECGVASGNSLAMLAALNRLETAPRRVLGFDSWEGLPEPRDEDLRTPGSVATRGAFSATHEDLVGLRLEQYGRDVLDAVTLVRGRFEDTLPHCPVERIAVLHLDVDLYDSYRTCLRHLWPKVSVNGVVAFDEYGLTDAWPGARLAVDEFFADKAGQFEMHRGRHADRHYAVKLAAGPRG